MFRFLLGNKRVLFLLLFFLLAIFLLSPDLQKRPFSLIQKPIAGIVSVVEGLFASVVNGIGSVWRGYINLVGVQKENVQLRREIEGITGEMNRLQGAQMTYERLEMLLGFMQASPSRLSAVQVLGRDPSNWYRTLIVNKGTQQGIGGDMGVITPVGVVGRVIKATPQLSQVLLMVDRNSAIAGIVERTRDEGIVEGKERGLLQMKYLPLTAEVAVGDRVITSGLAGVFPKGLMIGTVIGVIKRETDLFQTLQISPAVDFSKLEEVLVITSLPVPDAKTLMRGGTP